MSDENAEDEMGRVSPAQDCGPNRGKVPSDRDYRHPAATWGAAKSVGVVLLKHKFAGS